MKVGRSDTMLPVRKIRPLDFFRDTFLGTYDNTTCVFGTSSSSTSNRDSKLELYYQQDALETGVICSEYPVMGYNAEVPLPFSASYEGAITCNDDLANDYCSYDCINAAADGKSGISRSCTKDEVVYDPFDFNRGQSAGVGCANSQLLNVPLGDASGI